MIPFQLFPFYTIEHLFRLKSLITFCIRTHRGRKDLFVFSLKCASSCPWLDSKFMVIQYETFQYFFTDGIQITIMLSELCAKFSFNNFSQIIREKLWLLSLHFKCTITILQSVRGHYESWIYDLYTNLHLYIYSLGKKCYILSEILWLSPFFFFKLNCFNC